MTHEQIAQRIRSGNWMETDQLTELTQAAQDAWGEADVSVMYLYEIDVVDLNRLLNEINERRAEDSRP